MSLIASISGVRGTIGGAEGHNLTPNDIVKFAAAYAQWLRQTGRPLKVVIGRDARPSGPMVHNLACGTLQACGVHIVDIGLTTTPTVEMAVPHQQAGGGIILTASHNPVEWNALKLLNEKGEFISGADGEQVLASYRDGDFHYVPVQDLGTYTLADDFYLQYHIDQILALPLVKADLIRQAGLRVAVDAVNSSGGIYVPALLKALGVSDILPLYCTPNGQFPHNPEPLREHLGDICALVREQGANLAVVVDPDVDRLALIDETGEMFGEEYTLVAIADYILRHTPGHLVSNLSSSRALRDLAHSRGASYSAAAVGEVNVVVEMKASRAVLGGEGNGGVIYPELHYGRDALVGIALLLSHLAESGQKLSALKAGYPAYFMSKQKIALQPGTAIDPVLESLAAAYPQAQVDRRDGVKLDLPDAWIHLRKSNTEPIIRVYTEAQTQAQADALANEVVARAGALVA